MYENIRVTAVIAAAGKGSRMNSHINKQYIMLKDKPVLAHTLTGFEKCGSIDTIIVVAAPEDIDYCRKSIVDRFCLTKVRAILAGGQTRQQSVARGLEAVEDGIVVIHDGARPFVDCDLVEAGIGLLLEKNLDGAACALPVRDTVKLVGPDQVVERTLDREKIRAVQTPQCFLRRPVAKAHKRATREGIEATDDLALLEHYEYRVGLYAGRYDNIKITTPEDLLLARVLMEGRN
jgi:2-C-methyl-D-erythritol 4-phosphate cytidylyltransferase